MPPKQIEKKGYTAEQEEGGTDEEVANITAQLLAMGLDDFLSEVPASSTDNLNEMLPKLLDIAEDASSKTKAVKAELRKRMKEASKEKTKEKANETRENKKKEEEEKRNAVARFNVKFYSKEMVIEVVGGITVGELRRAIATQLKKDFNIRVRKNQITKMRLTADGVVISDRPRATLHRLQITSGCHIEALMVSQNGTTRVLLDGEILGGEPLFPNDDEEDDDEEDDDDDDDDDEQ